MQSKRDCIEGNIGLNDEEIRVSVCTNFPFGVHMGIYMEAENGDGGELLPVAGMMGREEKKGCVPSRACHP